MINARITEKSFKRWKLIINFAKKIFEKFDLCIASNKESENFLNILGAKKIRNFGNLKFSKSKNNLQNKQKSYWAAVRPGTYWAVQKLKSITNKDFT